MTILPIWQTAKLALALFFDLWSYAKQPLLIVLALQVLAVMTPMFGQSVAALGFGWLFGLASLIAMLPLMITWHQLIIYGSEDPRVIRKFAWTANTWRYLKTCIAYMLVILVVYIPAFLVIALLLITGNSESAALFKTIMLVAVFFVAAIVAGRFSLVLPSVAVEQPRSFLESWQYTEGHAIRIFIISLLAGAPFMAVSSVLGVLTPDLLTDGSSPEPGFYVLSMLNSVIGLIHGVVLVIVASLIYLVLIGHPDRPGNLDIKSDEWRSSGSIHGS